MATGTEKTEKERKSETGMIYDLHPFLRFNRNIQLLNSGVGLFCKQFKGGFV